MNRDNKKSGDLAVKIFTVLVIIFALWALKAIHKQGTWGEDVREERGYFNP